MSRSLAALPLLALIVLLLAGGVLAWFWRERVTGKNARHVIAERRRRDLTGRGQAELRPIEESFQELRRQILQGNFAGAQEGLSVLTRRSGLTRPRGDWLRFHLMLASLLNQDPENAQTVADAEVRAGPFSRGEADRALADALDAMARAYGKASQAVPASAAARFGADGAGAFAPLLFGLKDLELGVTEEALRLLDRFLATRPAGDYAWVADYRPLAEERVRDLRVLGGLRERLKGADTTGKQQTLLAECERARDAPGSRGKIRELFESSAGILRQQLENTRKDEAAGLLAREAALNDADKGRWQAVRETAGSATRLFRYEEALATLRGVGTLRGADFLAARDALVERTARLAAFKAQLIVDVNAGAARGEPFPTRNGTTYPRGLVRADASGPRAGTDRGETALAWADLDPRALVRLAGRLAAAEPDPRAAAERRWLAATFAQEVGLFTEARALAGQAARDRPEYRDRLEPQFR